MGNKQAEGGCSQKCVREFKRFLASTQLRQQSGPKRLAVAFLRVLAPSREVRDAKNN